MFFLRSPEGWLPKRPGGTGLAPPAVVIPLAGRGPENPGVAPEEARRLGGGAPSRRYPHAGWGPENPGSGPKNRGVASQRGPPRKAVRLDPPRRRGGPRRAAAPGGVDGPIICGIVILYCVHVSSMCSNPLGACVRECACVASGSGTVPSVSPSEEDETEAHTRACDTVRAASTASVDMLAVALIANVWPFAAAVDVRSRGRGFWENAVAVANMSM